jgi:formate hydrogenlyase subunit 6/NADH:ubiquinone oxidoreductase subunit I
MEDLTAYRRIAQKIEEQEPHTAPKAKDGSIHEAFIDHLRLVYSPEEAEIVQHLDLPESFTSSQEAAHASERSLEDVERILADVHSRNGIVGLGNMYCLPPIPLLVNLHHFYPEEREGDIEAARLYEEYFVKGGFYKTYENLKKGTPVGRVIPVGRAIEANQKVLAAEEAHDYILNHSSEELALVPCPCRTRTEKLGIRECKDRFPIGACIMMGAAALHFEMVGLGKRVSKQQALEYFDEMVELGLVGHTLNARLGDRLICLCCGCCCSQTRGRTRWDNPEALSPSNFVPQPGEDCIGCETCADRCLFGALSLDEETDQIRVDVEKCIGCGVCTLACTQQSLKLHRYERSSIAFETPRMLDEAMARENREG